MNALLITAWVAGIALLAWASAACFVGADRYSNLYRRRDLTIAWGLLIAALADAVLLALTLTGVL